MKSLLGNLRRTIQENDMIKDGDRVAVGLSGGKDSMVLLYALKKFQRFSPIQYDLAAATINLGFDNFDLTATREFCQALEVPFLVEDTNIAKIVFEARQEKNPCALCANMRRGALMTLLNKEGYNVLALGHHSDDAIETLFMNMLYTGKFSTLDYKAHLSRSDVHVIRPFMNVKEADIIGAVNKEGIPVTKSPCPMDKNTTREKMKNLLRDIYKDIPTSRQSILKAMKNEDQFKLWF
jgi:tRNA(Ile)-lysidine synthetase-like protein